MLEKRVKNQPQGIVSSPGGLREIKQQRGNSLLSPPLGQDREQPEAKDTSSAPSFPKMM